MKNQFNGDRNVEFLAPANGQESQNVLNYYSLAGINMWGWLGIEACFFATFFAFAFLALKYVQHVKR